MLVALVLVEASLASGAAATTRSPASAGSTEVAHDLGRPPAPLGGYRPHFVHQGLNNCAFASAAMLIDKWTHGDRRPSQEKMRAASGVPSTSGVGMSELGRAVRRGANVDVQWSPNGGDPLTWDRLLQRLGRGGAAVVMGAYSRLPEHYTRWGRDYAALGPSQSGHAVYIERFVDDRSGGRVWMMDPLASGANYRGEWISVAALKHFAWRTARGLVHAMATPEPPPLAGYEFGAPAVVDADRALAGHEVQIGLPYSIRPGWNDPTNLALSVVWEPEALDPDPEDVAAEYVAEVAAAHAAAEEERAASEDEDAASEEAPSAEESDLAFDEAGLSGDGEGRQTIDLSVEDLAAWRAAQAVQAAQAPAGDQSTEGESTEGESTGDQATGNQSMTATDPVLVALKPRGDRLLGSLRAPEAAGTYRVTVELRRRDGARFSDPAAPSLESFTVRLRGPLEARYDEAKAPSDLEQGRAASVSLRVANTGGLDWRADTAAELVATWHTDAGSSHAGTTTVELRSLDSARFDLEVIVPTQADEGTLTLELVTAEGIPFALYGAEPVAFALAFSPPDATDAELSVPQE